MQRTIETNDSPPSRRVASRRRLFERSQRDANPNRTCATIMKPLPATPVDSAPTFLIGTRSNYSLQRDERTDQSQH